MAHSVTSAPTCPRCGGPLGDVRRELDGAPACASCYSERVLGVRSTPRAAGDATPQVPLSAREAREAERWERLHQQLRWLPFEWAAINAVCTIAIGALVWFLRRILVG